MGYITKNLADNEKMLFMAPVHWSIYIMPSLLFAFGIYSFWAYTPEAKIDDLLPIIGILSFIVALLLFIRSFTIRRFTEIGVTNKRLICKFGVFNRNTNEFNCAKIESIKIDQSILDRLLDMGTVTISGTGISGVELKGIEGPIKLRKAIQDATANDL